MSAKNLKMSSAPPYYQQYESGLQPLRDYSIFSQNAKVIIQYELFEGQRTMEHLSMKYFDMYENIT